MKLAMFITSLDVGGAEKLILDLVCSLKNRLTIKLFVIRECKLTILDSFAISNNIDIVYLNSKLPFFSIRAANKLNKLIRDYSPDIIHTNLKSSSYIYYYRLFQKDFKWIHTVHSLYKVDTKFLRRMLFRRVYKRGIIHLVCVSATVSGSFTKDISSKVSIINNAVNLEAFKYQENLGSNNLITVARLSKEKNHKYLLNEFKIVLKYFPNIILTLIGEGRELANIRDEIGKLGIGSNVIIINSTNNIRDYIAMAGIFILPSFYEGLSLSVLEAMASGLIVIVSQASKELVQDAKNGFITELEEGSLSRILINVLKDINSFENLRWEARKTSLNYSFSSMADKYYNLYTKVLND